MGIELRKSHLTICIEGMREYFLNKEARIMFILEWEDFIAQFVGRTPNVVRKTTKLLHELGYIFVLNGKVTINLAKLYEGVPEVKVIEPKTPST